MRKMSLQAKFVFSLMVLGMLCAFFVNAFQIYYDFDRRLAKFKNELDSLERNALPAIESAVWSQDQQQMERLANSLFNLPHVQFLQLDGNGIHTITLGHESVSRYALTRKIELIHASDNRTMPIGTVTLQASTNFLFRQMWRDTGVLMAASVIQILLMTMAAGLLLRSLVLTDLRRFTALLSKRDLADHRSFSLASLEGQNNELTQLQLEINRLRRDQWDRETQVNQTLRKFEALAQNNPEIIWCLELKDGLHIENSPDSQVRSILDRGRLTHLNAPAKQLLEHRKNIEEEGIARFPIVNENMIVTLVESHYHLSDSISHCSDANGNVRYFRNCLSCWIEKGTLRAIWGIAFDITQSYTTQKALEQREQQLYLSQTRLSEAQALAHMGHWSYYVKSDELTVSDEFARIYGFEPDDDPPRWADLQPRIHPEDKSYVLHTLADPRTQAAGAEHRIIWPNGEIRFVQAITRKHICAEKVDSTFGILIDITDRRRAEEERGRSQRALAESEARLAQAQAIAHMGHWLLDCASLKLACSDEFYRLLDLAPQERQLNQANFISHVHPQDQSLILHLLDSAREKSFTNEFRIVRRDGVERFMRGTFTPYYAGGKNSSRIFGIMMDVTEQKQIEIQLRASQELFATAFDSSPDGIFFIDTRDHHFLKYNRALARMLNMNDNHLLIRSFDQLSVRLEKPAGKHVCEQMRNQTHATNVEVQIECDAAATVSALFSWQQVTIAQKPCFLGVIHDVTPIRRLQKTADEQKRQLIQADKLASIGTMVAGVAHEINNPNHLIQMNAELLEEFCVPIMNALIELPVSRRDTVFNGIPFVELQRTIPELLKDVRASSQRINRIVNDLKDFSRPQENSEYLPTDLNQLLDKTVDLFSAILEKRVGSVNRDFSLDLPMVRADSLRLEQVLVNLIMNAIEASEDSSPIELRTYFDPSDQPVICEIEDYGDGIPDDLLDKVFDPFFTTKQNKGGTRLGLAISYRLIQEHGGSLSAHRKSSGGTIMRVRLPIALANENAATYKTE